MERPFGPPEYGTEDRLVPLLPHTAGPLDARDWLSRMLTMIRKS